MVTFTAFFNTSCLLSNNACCTVTFRTHSNTSSLIGKQVLYGLTLADYRIPNKFKVEHMRVCDAVYKLAGSGYNSIKERVILIASSQQATNSLSTRSVVKTLSILLFIKRFNPRHTLMKSVPTCTAIFTLTIGRAKLRLGLHRKAASTTSDCAYLAINCTSRYSTAMLHSPMG
jgi:hypothetical protein